MIHESVSGLFGSACSAAHGNPEVWLDVARLTARVLDADRATIGFITTTGDMIFRACPETDPDWHAAYGPDLHAHNYIWSEAAGLGAGRIHLPCHSAARSHYLGSVIHNEFIRPQGMDALMTLCLSEPKSGTIGLLTVGREPFDHESGAAGQMVALALSRTIASLGVGRAAAHGEARELRCGELLVTPEGRLLRQEAWLEPWLRRGVFSLTGGVLSASQFPALAAAIRGAGREPDCWPPPMPIALGPVTRPMGRLTLRLVPGGRSGRGAVRIRAEITPDQPVEVLMARRRGLTARETEIAVLLATGLALPEIAARLGISLTTARTHLGHLFDKTETRTQVRLALFLRQEFRPRSKAPVRAK